MLSTRPTEPGAHPAGDSLATRGRVGRNEEALADNWPRQAVRAKDLLRAWEDMVGCGSGATRLSREPAAASRSMLEQGLSNLLKGSTWQAEVPPRVALASLRQAHTQFRMLSMSNLEDAARVEAAWHVRDAGFASLAVRMLDPVLARSSQRPDRCVHSLRALCMIDLGRLDEAVQSLHEAGRALEATEVVHSRRAQWYHRLAVSEFLAARDLLRRGIDCHLTDAASGHRDQKFWGEAGLEHSRWRDASLVMPAYASLPNMELERRALDAFVKAASAGDDAGRVPQLNQLIAELLVRPTSVSAEAWLYIGNSQLAVGQPRMAIACLDRAINEAQAQGRVRIQRAALVDLVHALEKSGQAIEALSALKSLRSLEAALREDAITEESPQAGTTAWRPEQRTIHNPHLRRAFRLLANPETAFTVESLAAACGVSRRTLEKAFRTELGQTVSDCLRQRRLGQVCSRLAESRDSIKKIALDCGYLSASAMCHDFKRSKGMTPTRFRADADPFVKDNESLLGLGAISPEGM